MITGPVLVRDIKGDFDQVEEIIGARLRRPIRRPATATARTVGPSSAPKRSLGSVVKLLTPSPEYTDDYNDWLRSIPDTIRDLVLLVKRLYKPDWEDDWRKRFSVDSINGMPGHELKYREPEDRHPIPAGRLRTQTDRGGSSGCARISSRPSRCRWRTISRPRSSSRPVSIAGTPGDLEPRRLEIRRPIANTDSSSGPMTRSSAATTSRPSRIFPQPGNFFSNYEPHRSRERPRPGRGRDPLRSVHRADAANVIREFAAEAKARLLSPVPAHPRLGRRQAQQEPPLPADPARPARPREATYLAESASRLYRRLPSDAPMLHPGECRAARPAQQSAGSRSRDQGPWRSTVRFTTRNCPNCSWTSSPA